MLIYTVTSAPATDADTASRLLTVTVNGEVVSRKEYPPQTATYDELSVKEGDNVVMTLVDIDDAGNSSLPAVVEFVAADTIPPVQPGQFGVTLAREE